MGCFKVVRQFMSIHCMRGNACARVDEDVFREFVIRDYQAVGTEDITEISPDYFSAKDFSQSLCTFKIAARHSAHVDSPASMLFSQGVRQTPGGDFSLISDNLFQISCDFDLLIVHL